MIHGGLQSSHNFDSLGAPLRDDFAVDVPDRRGRGLSGPFGDGYCMQTQIDDLAALLDTTGARYVFGLSSGALIALQAVLSLRAIRKLAIYEPPLAIEGLPSPLEWVPRYQKALDAEDLPVAMVNRKSVVEG